MMRFIILIIVMVTMAGCARAESSDKQTKKSFLSYSSHVNINYKKSLKFKTVCLNGVRYYVSTHSTHRSSNGFGFMAPAYESNGKRVQKCNEEIK